METPVTSQEAAPISKRVSGIKEEFPWITDEILSNIKAVISQATPHRVVVVWDNANNVATTFGVDKRIDFKPAWMQYRQNSLGVIQKVQGDIFAAATPNERIALIATETAEGLLSPEISDIQKTALAQFIVCALEEIEERPFNAVFFEILDDEIPMRVINFSPSEDF